jgi:ubiquinone biosynthesis protein UbiJ
MKNIDAVDVLNMVLFVGGLLAFIAGHLAAKGTREIQRQTEELRKNNAERVSQLKEL